MNKGLENYSIVSDWIAEPMKLGVLPALRKGKIDTKLAEYAIKATEKFTAIYEQCEQCKRDGERWDLCTFDETEYLLMCQAKLAVQAACRSIRD